jgi:hypothetical protein
MRKSHTKENMPIEWRMGMILFFAVVLAAIIYTVKQHESTPDRYNDEYYQSSK